MTSSSAYDAASRRIGLAAEVGGTPDFKNTYSYDPLRRLTRFDQESQPGGNAVAEKRFDFGYNAAGQITSLARYKDLDGGAAHEVAISTFDYDGMGRLTDLTHRHDTTTLVDYDWAFDAASRITQYVNSVDGTSDYDYDNTDQLTVADHTYQTDEDYSYDENGNRTNPGYSTGTNNRLLSDGTYTYEYDNEGNRAKRTHITSGTVTEYEWDHRNRLARVIERDYDGGPATRIVEYTYDHRNRWIAKWVDPDGDAPGEVLAVTDRYVYDGNQIVLAFREAANLTNRYLWGPAVDQILADEQNGSEVLWPLADHLNTVRDLADSTGSVVNRRVYDSFGNITSETAPAIDHLFAFTGRPSDEDTTLQNNLNRWYDPTVGRWLSEDPISFTGGDANLYRYVGNAPTDTLDPSGLKKGKKGNSSAVLAKLPKGQNCYWFVVFSYYEQTETVGAHVLGHSWIAIADTKKQIMTSKGLGANFKVTSRRTAGPGKLQDDSDRAYKVARAYPITKAQYQRLSAQLKRVKAKPPQYDLQDYNCTTWVIDIIDQQPGMKYDGPTRAITVGGAQNDPSRPDYTPSVLAQFLLRHKVKGSILFDNTTKKK